MQAVFAFVTLLARSCVIPLTWKHPQSSSHWVEMLLSIKHEKLSFSQKDSLNSFEDTWTPLLNHIRSMTLLPNCDNRAPLVLLSS